MNDNYRDEYFRVEIKKETLRKLEKTAKDAGTKLGETAKDAGTKIGETAKDAGAKMAGFGEDLQNRSVDARDPYESNLPIVDQCVRSTEDEIPVRQYNIAKLITPVFKKAEGRLQITNKRVLFRATGKALSGSVDYENEFALEEIGGIELKSDFVFQLPILIMNMLISVFVMYFAGTIMTSIFENAKAGYFIMMLLFLAGVGYVYFQFKVMHLLKGILWWLATCCFILYLSRTNTFERMIRGEYKFVLFIVLVLVLVSAFELILSGWVEDLQICVKIKGAHTAINIGRKLRKDERTGFLIVKPWKDTEIAIKELGACIDDIRRYGNKGVQKWKMEK